MNIRTTFWSSFWKREAISSTLLTIRVCRRAKTAQGFLCLQLSPRSKRIRTDCIKEQSRHRRLVRNLLRKKQNLSSAKQMATTITGTQLGELQQLQLQVPLKKRKTHKIKENLKLLHQSLRVPMPN